MVSANIKYASNSVLDGAAIDEPRVPSCDSCISRHISMCSVLKENEIHHMNSITDHVEKKAKEAICAEGDLADYVYNIQDGCVRISKMLPDGRRQVIGFLFAGDFFGLACAQGYSYSAEAITNVKLCRMPRDKILHKFNEFPKLGQKVFDIIRKDLQGTHDLMLLLGRKKANEKLCSFLLNLAEKSRHSGIISNDRVFLPMSRSDIADFLGLTIETVSRQFTILAKDKLILLEDNDYIAFLDEDHMKLIASGE